MYFVFHLYLKWLIKRNYTLRLESAISGDGKHPDEWYWADILAARYGYFVGSGEPIRGFNKHWNANRGQ